MINKIHTYLGGFIACLLFCAIFSTVAQAKPLQLANTPNQVSILEHSTFLFSTTPVKDLDAIKHVSSMQWQETLETFVFNGGEFWIKTQFNNPTDSAISKVIYFEKAHIFEIDLTHLDQNNQVLYEVQTGSNRPIETKPIITNGFAFNLTFPANQVSTIFTRLDTTGLNRFGMDILTADHFQNIIDSRKMWEISFYSIWVFLFFYNVSVFLLTRESIFFSFSFFPVLMATLAASDSGFLFELFPMLRGTLGLKIEMFSLCLIIYFLVSIHDIFKPLRLPHPTLYFINYSIKVTTFCLFALCFSSLYLGITKLIILLCAITLIITTFQVYYLAAKRYQSYSVLSIVWTIFLLGAGMSFMTAVDLLDKSVITDNSVHWSILLSYSLLSLTIVKKLQAEKTSAKHAMEESRKNISRFYDIFQNAEEGIFSCDDDGIIKDANPALCTLLQNKNPEGQNIANWFNNIEEKQEIFDELHKTLRIKNREVTFLDAKNRLFWLSISLRIMPNSKNSSEHIKGTIVDITDLKATEQKLNYVADHDNLTGLLNRNKILEEVSLAINKYEHCFGININLDSFSAINESCGQLAGNQLLSEIASLLVSNTYVRHQIARIQSDEFFILLPNVQEAEGIELAHSIKEKLSPFAFEWDQKNFKINASIGCAAFDKSDHDLRTIYERTVISLKQAKLNGGNRIEYYSIDNHKDNAANILLTGYHRINDALKNDNFVLFYQPIQTLGAKEGLHYEVLIRLQDAKGGIIAPGEFLPAAERFNLMQDIDRWVINHFFNWVTSNPEHEAQLECASINLSGSTLSTPESIERINDLFNQYPINPKKICFEITETMAITHLETTRKFIKTFKDKGCRFSLDDFGTGYSSYSYLANLDVDYVKIDGSFVKDIVCSPSNQAMVKSIHDVAMAMELKTIAEFVENEDIVLVLRSIGINYAQGYGIAKPAPLSNHLISQVKAS
ncbi:EAL domain-containing protein [Marinicellulosiphila megalodicopiae]|uniref:EAL domain-containing protein n=1 Tax=Marinicellulosiphila megalodicopiae TaxID=2724896 RepID=UPI003BAE520E